jgi:hypothetical protein
VGESAVTEAVWQDWNLLTGVGTLALALAAFSQILHQYVRSRARRRFDIAAKDVRMTEDGGVHIAIANLSEQYIVLRYLSLHDRSGARIAHLFHNLVSTPPGDVLRLTRSEVKLRPSDGEWDLYDGVAPVEMPISEAIECAASIRMLFQIGGDPERFHHVLLPRYLTRARGQPVFSHTNMRVVRSSRRDARGLSQRDFASLNYQDPRPPEREET